MSFPWYSAVDKDAPLDQGELITDCPVVTWKDEPLLTTGNAGIVDKLKELIEMDIMDVVVMTQTCDLAHDKVNHVILCPHYSLEEYREAWEEDRRRVGEEPKEKSWKKHLANIVAGQIWNLSMMNRDLENNYKVDHRIVDFHEVFSLPRDFLQCLVRESSNNRLKLLPPYREHLSQAFARYFMRVGLPTDIDRNW